VADVITPNVFELAYLAGVALEEIDRLPTLLDAVDRVRAMGPSTILVTSVESLPGASADDYDSAAPHPDQIAMLAVDPTGAFLVRTPRLPISVNGAGDVTAALFLAHLSSGVRTALARVASSVYAILRRTAESGAREIQLIAAQQEIAEPAGEFDVVKIR
jgi:pyridoxine kinase